MNGEELFNDFEDNFIEVDNDGEIIADTSNHSEATKDDNDQHSDEADETAGDMIEITDDGEIKIEGNSDDSDKQEADSEDNDGSKDNKGMSAGSSDDKGDSSELIKAFASGLHQKGIIDEDVLSLFDETDDPEEALFEAIHSQVQNSRDEWIASLPPRVKHIVENYKEGVPLNQLLQLEAQSDAIENIDENSIATNEGLQRDLITQFYKTKGFSDTKINKLIERAEDLDELEDEAKDAYTELKAINDQQKEQLKVQAAQQRKAAEENRKKQLELLDTTLNEAKEIIPGIPVNKKIKNEIKEYMTKPIEIDENNTPISYVQKKRMEDTMGFDMKLNYYIKLGLFDKEPNMDALKNTAKTKAGYQFKKELEKNRHSLSGRSSSHREADDGTASDILKSLENF